MLLVVANFIGNCKKRRALCCHLQCYHDMLSMYMLLHVTAVVFLYEVTLNLLTTLPEEGQDSVVVCSQNGVIYTTSVDKGRQKMTPSF